jgi:hypothetical protein
MIKENLADFDKDDCVLFVTLEDDIYKLSRRFMSIFGHYHPENVKSLFAKGYEVTRSQQIMGQDLQHNNKMAEQIQAIFNTLLQASIARVTQGKVSLIIKHCNENTFSYGDLGRFIDRLKVEGYNVKMVFVDYLDAMISSFANNNNGDDYITQGQIVQEGRTLSRIHKIPIIIPTQNNKESENVTSLMSNRQIGDSYKKIRFSDFVYMMRMREDLNFLSEYVRNNVVKKDMTNPLSPDVTPDILAIKDKLVDILVPVEIKITKSKDSAKNQTRFLLFCKENLCIYNNVQEYIADIPQISTNNTKLVKDINLLLNLAIVNTVTNDFIEDDNSFSMSLVHQMTTTQIDFGVAEEDDSPFIPTIDEQDELFPYDEVA